MPDRIDGRRVDGIALTLWVDEDGVVRQWESNSELSDEFARGEIVRFDDDPFVIDPPLGLVDGPRPAAPLTPIPDDRVERPVDPVDQPPNTVSA